MKNSRRFLNVLFLFFIGAGSVFVCSYSFMDALTVPKWYWTLVSGAIFTFVMGITLFFSYKKTVDEKEYWRDYLLIIYIISLSQALYCIAQYFGSPENMDSPAKGSFDNPAGLAVCLSAGLPFIIYFCRDKNIFFRYMSVFSSCIIGTAVLASESRAGFLSALIVSFLFFLNRYLKIVIKKRISWLLFVLVFVVLTGCYYVKKDSADGRILIWACTLQMIKDKPVFGHGIASFEKKYMLCQADYFECNPDSKYAYLADNVRHPFNEYLLILTEYGIIGLLVVFVFFFFVWRQYRKKQDEISFVALLCLLSIGVFACFSYPLRYPFTWVLIFLCVFLIFRDIKLPKKLIRFFSMMMVLTSPLLFLCVIRYVEAELHWRRIFLQSLSGRAKDVITDYADVEKVMGENSLFLYNWGAELYEIGAYKESLIVLKKCENRSNGSDIQLLIADNYCRLGDYVRAEKHYMVASRMCPKLFSPFYKLFNLYKMTGDVVRARRLALFILEKPVKINNSAIQDIKQEMYVLLKNDME